MAIINEQPEIRRCPAIGCSNMVIGSTFCFLHKREKAELPEHETRAITYEELAKSRRSAARDSTGDE